MGMHSHSNVLVAFEHYLRCISAIHSTVMELEGREDDSGPVAMYARVYI